MNKARIELEIEHLVLPLLKSKRTYLDIGACIGKASKALVDVFDNIIVFEPNPESLSVLREINGIRIEEAAVSDYIGSTEFIVPVCNKRHERGFLPIDNNTEIEDSIKYKVNVTTIDSYRFEGVDFIKIDTEGNELNVLKGAIETIKKYKPIIYYEDKGKTEKDLERRELIKKLLQELGYNIQRTHRYWQTDNQSKADMLAISNIKK
jgi:FkbM family methyltransferase